MRRVFALAALLLLGACSSSGTSGYAQYYQLLKNSVAASFGDGRISRDQAAAIPYASMGYRLNGGNEQLVVLATDTNGEQLWTSAAHVVIATRGGRITRTVGLEHDIAGMAPRIGQQIPDLVDALKAPSTYVRVQDFPSLPAYGAALTCSLSYKGPQTVTILGRAIATARIDEACRSANPRLAFTNNYWIDPETGRCWRSRQYIGPQEDRIDTEIFRPPG